MRFELEAAGWIPEEVKEAIRRAEKNKFTKEGWLVVTSTRHRTQRCVGDAPAARGRPG
jgi:peptidyl-tRNA hydrolase ICT1